MTIPSPSEADPDRFTAAARRVLDRAGRIAAVRGHRVVDSAHLLRALLDDESRGAELLAERGFDPASLEPVLDALPNAEHADSSSSNSIDPPRGDAVVFTILEAGRLARLGTVDGTVGSEHLLFGLAFVDSTVTELLLAHELDEAAATALARGPEPRMGEPLPVDFVIDFEADTVASDLVPPTNAVTDAVVSHPGVSNGRGSTPTERERLDLHRVIDAAANRAREGLRVAEDHARFLLDDAHLVGLLKGVRHDLADRMAAFDATALLRARETIGDVGREITTSTEHVRADAGAVLRAALKRTQEALRTLEEFGKVLAPGAGPGFESLRYRVYTIEKAAMTTVAARADLANRGLYLLLTRELCRLDPETVVRMAIRGGVSIVQVREKSLPDRELLNWCRTVRRLTREQGALLILNDRPDIAVACEADGVHVGQEELGVRDARRILGPDRLVGVSTHDLAQARRAVLDGADYIGIGPTFPSGTKSFDLFPGLEFVREVAGEIGLPVYAIGGIDLGNVDDVVAAGVGRVAVTRAVCSATDPESAAASLALCLAAKS